MTGLEAALAQVIDREGRPIGERIDAEAPLVDELRVPDDTGPVLRRALDRVEHQPDGEPDGSPGDRPDSADHAERDDLQPDPRPDHDHDRHHDHGAS
ncbi:MAG: hypothetical protein ACN4IE_05500, partial [Ilumatobacter sp.]